MNENFINIKVDREERPDLDRQYMMYVQATTGSGGWPLNVFISPYLTPIFGGTYFSPRDDSIEGRPSFKTILETVSKRWKDDWKILESNGRSLVEQLKKQNEAKTRSEAELNALVADLEEAKKRSDAEHGKARLLLFLLFCNSFLCSLPCSVCAFKSYRREASI